MRLIVPSAAARRSRSGSGDARRGSNADASTITEGAATVKPLDVACHRHCDEEGSNQRTRCQCRYRDSGEWSSHAALLSCVVHQIAR
jgi:hypothetical protein